MEGPDADKLKKLCRNLTHLASSMGVPLNVDHSRVP